LAWITWSIYRSCADEKTAAIEEINDLYASGAGGLLVTIKEEGFWPGWKFEGWGTVEAGR
jgi:hypothetical protein